jgi:hypothetical protein
VTSASELSPQSEWKHVFYSGPNKQIEYDFTMRLRLLSRIFEHLKLKLLSIGFFLALIVVGLLNFRKYGISWEAPALRLNGGNALIYIADLLRLDIVPSQYRQFAPMGENGMADHGVAYDVPLVALEAIFGIQDPMSIYQFRTLMNFLVFVIGAISVYLLVKRRLASEKLALLASLFFVLSPRVFAAGFYSPSDMVFTSFFALGVNLAIRFMERPTWQRALFAGAVSGFATDIRLLGIVIFPLICFLYVSMLLNKKHVESISLRPLMAYLASGALSIYIFFPYLWEDPIRRFIEVFLSLSKYNWEGRNLYFGELIQANDLPWHYIPVWITITTPILYLILFIFGSVLITIDFCKKRHFNFVVIQDLLFLGLIVGPIFMVVVLGSVLYDTWRHLFFIYPFIIVIATIGWSRIFLKGNYKKHFLRIKIGITSILLLQTALWMYSNNPNQNLYFNLLAGDKSLEQKWEMDYLGLSNKEGLNYILSENPDQQVSVAVVSFTAFDMSLKALPAKYIDKVVVVPVEEQPDFIVNNFRLRDSEFMGEPGYELWKEFKVDNSKYLEIWKKTS